MEDLMIQAIRKFRSEHPKAEIRSCYAAEWTGTFKDIKDARFAIEYVKRAGNDTEYCEEYITVNREQR